MKKVVELQFSRLDLDEFDLILYSLMNTSLTCTDASIRLKTYHLRDRILACYKVLNVDESYGNNI